MRQRVSCGFASLHRPPARCTSAAPARRCSTGCSRAGVGGRHARAAHRGHRPRALDAGERRADPRRAALAGARLGRGPDPPDRPRADRHGEALQAAARPPATPTARTRPPTTCKAYKQQHGAERGFRGGRRGQRRGASARARRARRSCTTLIRGDTRFDHVHMDDPVIARADGSVLYNFAVAIDDLDAEITHVVRGEDHLSNTPKQLLVLEAAKRSASARRAAADLRASAAAARRRTARSCQSATGRPRCGELREAGYLPAAVRNYLALLGWGAGDDQTVLSTAELIERFTLDTRQPQPRALRRAQAALAERRATCASCLEELEERLRRVPGGHWSCGSRGDLRFPRAVAISQEKIHTLADFWPLGGPSARRLRSTMPRRARSGWARRAGDARRRASGSRRGAELRRGSRRARRWKRSSAAARSSRARSTSRCAWRSAGTTVSPGIFESVALLGRDETLRRIDAALARG